MRTLQISSLCLAIILAGCGGGGGSSSGGNTDDTQSSSGNSAGNNSDNNTGNDPNNDSGSGSDAGDTGGDEDNNGADDGDNSDDGSTTPIDDDGTGEDDQADTPPANQAPQIVAPSRVYVSHTQAKPIAITVEDADGDNVTVSWQLLSSPSQGDLIFNYDATQALALFSASTLGNYSGQLTASDGTNSSSITIDIEVKNYPPEYASFEFGEDLYADSYIHARLSDVRDLDGDELSLSYQYFVNGVRVQSPYAYELPPNSVVRGDQVTAEVEISDGYNTITATATAEILNSPPYIGYLSLQGAAPNTTQDINVALDYLYDADENDALEVTYQWAVNGANIDNITSNLLPAGTAQKGDVVSVTATASDGIDTRQSNAVEITIADAPAVIEVTNLPQEINHNTLLEFDVTISDPDGDPGSAKLAYGPAGMHLDGNGHVTWTPNEIMFGRRETFQFGFGEEQQTDNFTQYSIDVIDINRARPTARSGIEIPTRSNSLWVANFDQDSNQEILATDNYARVFTLEYDGSGYQMEWLYPYRVSNRGTVKQVLPIDSDADGISEIIVVNDDKISYISGLDKQATTLVSSTQQEAYSTAAVADINNDGRLDFIYVENKTTLNAVTFDDWSELFTLGMVNQAEELLIGNVDADSALEIVIDNGYVVDGVTGNNEWFRAGGFGQNHALADVDADGVEEIAGYSESEGFSVYSAVSKSQISNTNTDYLCDLAATNVDDDPQTEIIAGSCDWEGVWAWDLSTGNAVEDAHLDGSQHYSVSSIAVGDADSDGTPELLWGASSGFSGEDAIYLVQLDDVNDVYYNQSPAQLDQISAAGWGDVTPGNPQAAFVVGSTDNGYNGQRVALMSDAGELTISPKISDNWWESFHGEITDYDQDGYAELFLSSADVYDGVFRVLELENFTTEWGGNDGDYDDQYSVVKHADVNGDGYSDAIVINNSHIEIYDIQNSIAIWGSSDQNDYLRDIAVAGSANDIQLVTSAYSQLMVFQQNGNNFEQAASRNLECSRIATAELRNSDDTYIVCITEGWNNDTEITLLDMDLNTISTSRTLGYVKDFTVEETDDGAVNLLAATYTEDTNYYYWYGDFVRMELISIATGEKIWQSSTLLGDMLDHSIYYLPADAGNNKRATFSTRNVMYLSH